MKVKFKKIDLEDNSVVLPSYAKPGDAGLDLVANDKPKILTEYIEYGTGLAVEIPEGFVGLLFPRSSITKSNLMLKNSVGVIDSSYRGEIKLRFKRVKHEDGYKHNLYEIGDKIGQLIIMPYPVIEPEFAEELSSTERGEGGFGSTGQ